MIPLFVGLVPGIGDVITTALSLYIVNEARALGAPSLLVVRMLANVALDGVVGAVPLFGDVFDVAFRANRPNLALLREHLSSAHARAIGDRRAWSLLGKEKDRGEAGHRHPQNDDAIEPHGCTRGCRIPNDFAVPPPSR